MQKMLSVILIALTTSVLTSFSVMLLGMLGLFYEEITPFLLFSCPILIPGIIGYLIPYPLPDGKRWKTSLISAATGTVTMCLMIFLLILFSPSYN